jgi:hypothetical protein
MASKELSILLLAKDMASKTIGKVSKEITGLDKAGRTASRGLANLGANLAKIGAVAAVGLGVAVKSGLSSLAELESAVASVEGAIVQMGLTGQVTGAQVATWANEIEAATGAAFDDKAITQATSTLIRFGKVTESNIRPAMEIITDLATKTGDVESAATLLAKALADPTKAAGKLARSGVILTKSQQDQIKAFTEAGDAAAAQKVILDSLAETTKGAALASQGPYKRAMSVLADVTEDAQRALAEGFLPVLEKLAGKLSTALANPKVMANIREFGKGLASGLDSLISIAEKLPWGAIGDSLKVAGAGAKAVLGAFVALPPWVQTAVLTGWGLNKLTGGALGSLVGQLAGGLIKGVLGIQAGVVNVTGGVVNGPGGIGGKGGLPVGALPGVGGAVAAVGGGAALAAAAGTAAALVAGGVALYKGYELLEGARTEEAKNRPVGPRGNLRGFTDAEREARNTTAAVDSLKSETTAILTRVNSSVTAGDSRTAGRIDSLNAAIRAIKIQPKITVPVYVTSTVSVRNTRVATAVSARYGGSNRIYEP